MDYEIKYSKRRSLAIEITKDARVVVRAPLKMPKKEILSFVEKNENWILSHLESRLEKNREMPEPSDEEKAILKEKAKVIIPEKVKFFSQIMGVFPENVSINSAKTRFGSCSSKNRLNFSLYLMRYPDEAIDYVVVHELAHIKHHNHSKNFWTFVEKFMPDYKERKKLLK